MGDEEFGRNASRFLGKAPARVVRGIGDVKTVKDEKEWTCPECDTQNSWAASKCKECGSKAPANAYDQGEKAEPQPNAGTKVTEDCMGEDEGDLITAQGEDEWSPEAREAAAKARKGGNPNKVAQERGPVTRSIIAQGTKQAGLHGKAGREALQKEAGETNHWKNEAVDA